jgi:hypothetical protein
MPCSARFRSDRTSRDDSARRSPDPFTRMTIVLAAVVAVTAPAMARADFLSPAETARRACEQALAAEDGAQTSVSSRLPCHQAMLAGASPRDFRNEVASLMAPRARPSLDDLVLAALSADAAVHKGGDGPWGYIARCDIARKLKNADLMQACLEDLHRLPAGQAAAARADATTTAGVPAPVRIARLLLLLGLAGTLAHALKSRRRLAILIIFAACAGATLAPRRARAEELPKPGQPLSTFQIDEAAPEASVPSADQQAARPLEFGYFLQDLAAKAEKADKDKDYAAAARYDRALTRAAPQSAVGPRKLCYALQAAGDIKNAIVACRTALTRQGSTSDDYLHFVQVVLSLPGPLGRDEHKELKTVLTHLEGEAKLGALPWMFRCEIALRFGDHDGLVACTRELTRLAPRDPKTASFQWALAVQDHDRGRARAAVDRARLAGMSPAALHQMETATRAMTLRWLGRMFVAALAVALIIGGSLVVLRRSSRVPAGGARLTSRVIDS